ncbi:MAG: hypothetical protein AAB903_03080, partial [Patescibacteria group bacterium]
MNNFITPPQCRHLIEVFETLESGQLQALIASGLLTDLRRCVAEFDPRKIDRGQYQRILGIDPSVFTLKMGGSETTDQIVAVLRESGIRVNECVTQKNFPLTSGEAIEDEIELVDPNRDLYFKESLAILKEKGLMRPTEEHAIRFSQQHGLTTTSTKKPCIIFPHKPWLGPGRSPRVVCVCRYPVDRELFLRWAGGWFYD